MRTGSDSRALSRPEIVICLLLAIATVAVYCQVRNHGFVYDDVAYVTDNLNARSGLTWPTITWAFTAAHSCNWHPLTWLSHMLDVHLYGVHPGPHHMTNVLIHILNTLLLFFVLRRMRCNMWQSSFVAAFLALHPLHVESVAWISE